MVLRTFLLAVALSGAPCLFGQVIPPERLSDWAQAGATLPTDSLPIVDAAAYGLVGDGQTPNEDLLNDLIKAHAGSGAVLLLPEGHFRFEGPLKLQDGVVLRGASSEATVLEFSGVGEEDLIQVRGTALPDTLPLAAPALRGSRRLLLESVPSWGAGTWLQLLQEDGDRITSSWAAFSTGQIVRVDSIADRQVWLAQPLRQDYELERLPRVVRLKVVKGVGLECLKIRSSNPTDGQTANLAFAYAVDCWVRGVESENCNFAHLRAERSARLLVEGCYFHRAFDYGGGGKGYGVVLQFATGDCLVQNNVFERLRHAMLLQAGANGNVFAYNFSTDPFWTGTSLPANAAGDIVLHGNYPYANLFEGNICQNIVLDDSHGPNGPLNTFFRNRTESYGLFMSPSVPSNRQNFVGNVIAWSGSPLVPALFVLSGEDHFLYGNHFQGSVTPPGTEQLPDTSLFLQALPPFLAQAEEWLIGTPYGLNTAANPARLRYLNAISPTTCPGEVLSSLPESRRPAWRLYPNPSPNGFWVEGLPEGENALLEIFDSRGRRLERKSIRGDETDFFGKHLPAGLYWVHLLTADG
ncbi:MAG: T9SS C-terminal target domain-containing protein, partial [Bacteroidetes bacterium]